MKTRYLLITPLLICALLLAGCNSEARVGTLHSESQKVALGDTKSVHVQINFGAGDLYLTGGAEKLMEADFNYNVAKLKPEVDYTNNTLVVQQPDVKGLPFLQDISGFRNEWNLRLSDKVPMDLSVDIGGGYSDLQLANLLLTQLDVNLGAGRTSVDLSHDWLHDLFATIHSGAAEVTVVLPKYVGARVEIEPGPSIITAPGLEQNGNVYTNAAYGVSQVTLNVNVEPGIGQIKLEIGEEAAATHN